MIKYRSGGTLHIYGLFAILLATLSACQPAPVTPPVPTTPVASGAEANPAPVTSGGTPLTGVAPLPAATITLSGGAQATFTPVPTPTPTPLPPTSAFGGSGGLAPQTDVLFNGGFESPVGVQQTADWFVPEGWSVWTDCSLPVHSEIQHHPPDVHSGTSAGRLWQSWSACEVMFYQVATTLPGGVYDATAYGFGISTSNPVVGALSEDETFIRIGADPTGGSDPRAGSVQWSQTIPARDDYQQVHVVVIATTERMTVFLSARPNAGLFRSDAFWDDAALIFVGMP